MEIVRIDEAENVDRNELKTSNTSRKYFEILKIIFNLFFILIKSGSLKAILQFKNNNLLINLELKA